MHCVSCNREIEEPDPDLGPEQLCEPCFDRIDKQMEPINRLLNDQEFLDALAEHVEPR